MRGLVVVALDAIWVEALSNGGGVEPGVRPPREGVATSAMTFGKAALLRSRSKRAAQSATTRVAAMSSFASAICSLPTVAPGRSSKGFSNLNPPKERRVPRRCRGVAVGVGASAAPQAASAATRIESMV